jgi:uncharacterized membrane protein
VGGDHCSGASGGETKTGASVAAHQSYISTGGERPVRKMEQQKQITRDALLKRLDKMLDLVGARPCMEPSRSSSARASRPSLRKTEQEELDDTENRKEVKERNAKPTEQSAQR